MSARLRFSEVEALLPVAGYLPTVGELPVPRWDDPAGRVKALRWWRSCRRCRTVGRTIFEALLHQRQCLGGCAPDWPTEDADGAR